MALLVELFLVTCGGFEIGYIEPSRGDVCSTWAASPMYVSPRGYVCGRVMIYLDFAVGGRIWYVSMMSNGWLSLCSVLSECSFCTGQ